MSEDDPEAAARRAARALWPVRVLRMSDLGEDDEPIEGAHIDVRSRLVEERRETLGARWSPTERE